MATLATHTHPKGTQFYYSTDGVSYTEFVELISCAPPDLERGHSDDTILTSFGEVTTPGWIKATDADFELYMTKSIYSTMVTAWAAGTIYYWKVAYVLIDSEATQSKWVWQGYIAKIATSKAEKLSDDKIMATLTVRRTTAPAFTAGS